MNLYIIVLGLYLIGMFLAYIYRNKMLIGLSGIAFLYPIMEEGNTIIIILSIILMLFHFIIAFYSDKENEDF